MGIRLIAFDLDGTLLNSRKEVTPENLAALHAAAEKGILTVPASGRLYPGLPDELKGSDFRYSILCNGMTVYDAAEDMKLCDYPISLEEETRLHQQLEQELGSIGLRWQILKGVDDKDTSELSLQFVCIKNKEKKNKNFKCCRKNRDIVRLTL